MDEKITKKLYVEKRLNKIDQRLDRLAKLNEKE